MEKWFKFDYTFIILLNYINNKKIKDEQFRNWSTILEVFSDLSNMIQYLVSSFNTYRKSKNRKIVTVLLVSGILFTILLSKYHLTKEESINTLLNNIFQFSGIFSALLISFIISKIFHTRQEKLNRLKEIISLSNRTTDFRRICKILFDEDEFWNEEMRRKMMGKYKPISYFHIHLDITRSQRIENLIGEYHKDKNKIGADFFLGVKSLLSGSRKVFELELYDDYDHNIVYPLKLVEFWYGANSANTFWYYLENKWHTYNTAFNFGAFSQSDQESIIALAKKINKKKYRAAVFDKDLLVSIGNDFNSHIFPRLFRLTYYNEKGLSETINFLIRILVIIMVFGVFIPLWLSSIIISNINLKIIISNISIIFLSLSIVYLLFNFKVILKNEIKISRENI